MTHNIAHGGLASSNDLQSHLKVPERAGCQCTTNAPDGANTYTYTYRVLKIAILISEASMLLPGCNLA